MISQYDYENAALGRRTAISRSGAAFGDTPVTDAYGYNDRSEVTSTRRTLASNPSQEVRGFSYDYAYDPIGNRVSSTEYDPDNNALVSLYNANALNQYQERTIPGYAAVRGSATNSATVTVNGNPTWRLDDYFYGGDEADNSTTALMKELAIIAAQSNHYAAATGHVFIAQTPEEFTYDGDGNLTQDGRFTYTWDAENRLIGVTTRDDLPVAVPRIRVTHSYDHKSRRIATATAVWTNNIWQPTESRTITYDDWNVVREVLSPESGVLSTNLYVWGLDLSGSPQSAGGIGGLLSATFDNATALYTYDANGNVGQLIAISTNGTITAHYEYDPFGGTIIATGTLAKTNPFRFSTKWFDNATLLGDWGYRWYSPGMGRWPSRDPINERGGQHLYGFCLNQSLNRFDPDGRFIYPIIIIPPVFKPSPPSQWLWPWQGCCDGKKYNMLTECCCTSGDKPVILEKKEIPTGIRRCNLPRPGEAKGVHYWTEVDGWSAGFYGDPSNLWGLPGTVQSPEAVGYVGSALKECEEIMLSPCEYDIEAVKDAILYKALIDEISRPKYNLGTHDCRHWSKNVITFGKKEGKGCSEYPKP